MANRGVAVLDIGSSKITVVIGSRGVNNTFNIRGWGECEYDGFEDGEFHAPAKLNDILQHTVSLAETNAQQKIEKLYIGVPGDFTDCCVKDVSISLERKRKIAAQDVEELFRQGKYNFDRINLAEAVISCAPVYFSLDDSRNTILPIGHVSSKLSGRISYLFCKNNFMQIMTSITRELGIEETEYIPAVLAEISYLFEPEKRDSHVLLIDVGHITTNIVLARGDGILGLKTINIGGGHITAALYTLFEPAEYQIAELLKRKVALTLNATEKDFYEVTYKCEPYKFNAQKANEIVKECVEGMSELISKAIISFGTEYPDNTCCYLTGGGISYMRGARDLLSRQLNKHVEIIEPSVPQLDKPHLSSVLGVLDTAIEDETRRVTGSRFFGRLKSKFSRS